MLPRYLCYLILFALPILCFGQIDESFDQDLNQWSGDTAHFIINSNKQLQLNAQEGGRSTIFQKTNIPDSCTWELEARLNFAPSGSNRVRCFLQTEDTIDYNGYAVEWGESGGDDAVEFVRYDNGQATILGRLLDGAVANEPSTAAIQILRSEATFHIKVDYNFDGSYTDSITITDNTYPAVADQYFILDCAYTSTRIDRFIFDNIFVGRATPDTIAPKLLSTRWKLDTLVLSFDESIVTSFAEAEWVQDPGAQIFIKNGIQPNELGLYFGATLEFGAPYRILLNGVQDLSGNEMQDTEIPFVYNPISGPDPFEVLISEVMAAPSEETALPNVEYVELINRSTRSIQLSGLQFTDGSRVATLPDYIMPPGALIVLCGTADSSELRDFSPVLGLESFPGLNNGGDELKLLSANGIFIHGINYTDNWYQDPAKDDGGWSLELVDTSYACLGAAAYRASNDPRGGSPASANEQSAPPPSLPLINEVEIFSNQQLVIRMDQWVAGMDEQKEDFIKIEPERSIDFIRIPSETPNQIELILSQPIQEGTLYDIIIDTDFRNCILKSLDTPLVTTFGLPEIPDSGDIQISEVMFDPASGGAQWIEIYNNSDKVFSWKDLYISFRAPDQSDQLPMVGDDLMLPGRYYVLTEDPEYVKSTFEVPFPTQVRSQELPSMDRNEGILRLDRITSISSTLLEEVCYNEDWHSGFVREPKGVSLERLNYAISGCSKDNWQSAAETAGFATPTGLNSQTISNETELPSAFSLQSPSFSPDGDGFEDQMVFRYQAQEGEEPPQLDLFVYSLNGNLIKTLANNLSLGQNAQILWDGTDDNNLKMAEGYYLIKARTYADNGTVQDWQATVYLIYPN